MSPTNSSVRRSPVCRPYFEYSPKTIASLLCLILLLAPSSALAEEWPEPSGDDLHPRTGIGLSQDGHQLFIIAIDGRRHSSQGATTRELGEWMKRCGADDAINMDGGGSTTLAWWNPDSREALLINSPVGSGLKFESPEADRAYFPTERANGNNLGIYFEPESKSP